jgi:hypothetical protein
LGREINSKQQRTDFLAKIRSEVGTRKIGLGPAENL